MRKLPRYSPSSSFFLRFEAFLLESIPFLFLPSSLLLSYHPRIQRVLLAGRGIEGIFRDSSLPELLELDLELMKQKNEVIWIDIDSPSQQDLQQLEKKFGLHPITTEDLIQGNNMNYWLFIQHRRDFRDYRIIITLIYLLLLPLLIPSQWNQDTREKVETFENYLFVVAKEMHYAHYSNHLVVVNINIIVFSNWVITIHPSDIECVEQVKYYSMI